MLADWTKPLSVVNALLLHEALGYQPGLVPLYFAQSIPLDLEHPLDLMGLTPLGCSSSVHLQFSCRDAVSSAMASFH